MKKFFFLQTIQNAIGEDALQEFINFSLRHISELKLPFKRGTFIEFRNGMLNISPMGRNASIEERNFFEEYDNQNKVRQKFIEALKKQFPDIPFTYSIGKKFAVFDNQTILFKSKNVFRGTNIF